MKDLAKKWQFWACIGAALILGILVQPAVVSDEVTTEDVQRMSLEDFQKLNAKRDELNRTLDKFQAVWKDKLTTIHQAGSPVTRN